MCYLVYTNYQRQGAVVNMTMRELKDFTMGRPTLYSNKTTHRYLIFASSE